MTCDTEKQIRSRLKSWIGYSKRDNPDFITPDIEFLVKEILGMQDSYGYTPWDEIREFFKYINTKQ